MTAVSSVDYKNESTVTDPGRTRINFSFLSLSKEKTMCFDVTLAQYQRASLRKSASINHTSIDRHKDHTIKNNNSCIC